MKAGIHAIIMKIRDDAEQHGNERYAHIKDAINREIEDENAMYSEESDKQREVFSKHNEHEYSRRLEYQRSRLNREMLVYQHELIDEIFDAAVEKLKAVPDGELFAMLKAAVRGMEGTYILHSGELSAGRLDDYVVKEAAKANTGLNITLSTETIPGKSGFALRDDRVEYDFLFEDLVEDLKSERITTIIKDVFGNSADWMFA